MTLPNERARAVIETAEFLKDLADPGRTSGVPEGVRDRARRLLRHYPMAIDLVVSARALPATWEEPNAASAFETPGGPGKG